MATQSIQNLTPRHYRILDCAIAGLSTNETAKAVGMSPHTVSIILHSPSFQHQFAVRRSQIETTQADHQATEIDDVKKVLREAALSAAEKLISGISSENAGIALKSATEILDRSGYPKEQKVSNNTQAATQVIINTADLKNLTESLSMVSVESKEIKNGAEPITG